MVETGGAVLCVGVFDGVHLGHRALLAEGRRQADARGLPLVAVTFDPHPMAVVGQRQAPTSLADLPHRRELLREAGADRVDVLRFDDRMAQLSPQEFISTELIGRRHAQAVVVGENFRFGHGASGSVDTLREVGGPRGLEVTGVPLVGDGTARWSSTDIRGRVRAGDVAGARDGLGRPYGLGGVIVHGDHRGRELGYPTANLAWEGNPTIPADGVYAGWLVVGADRLPAAISVGTNPQFDGVERRVEAYVIDGVGLDLYGASVRVEFTARLRGQERFAGVDALIEQMGVDVAVARDLLFPDTPSEADLP